MRKSLYSAVIAVVLSLGSVSAISEASALFLLISPGARAGGMGEAQVAVANDAYASYWNPAGLAFLRDSEVALMHVNWLQNLVPDMYYEFLAYHKHVPSLGTLGGHIIFLNLGEQERRGENNEDLGTFTSFMYALTLSYGANISPYSSIGLNAKILHQNLTGQGAGAERGEGVSTDFAFDIAYLKKGFLIPKLDMGITVTNIGPKVSFIDEAQADPMPTNLTLGLNYRMIDTEFNKLNIVIDIDKMLVASYPEMDWDGDGRIGLFNDNGNYVGEAGEYNKSGDREAAHTDPIYLAFFTSWLDDWYLGGDIDWDENTYIGGYYENGLRSGEPFDDFGPDGLDGTDDEGEGDGEWNEGEPFTNLNGNETWDKYEWGDEGYGKYNADKDLEVGTGKSRSFSTELDELVFHFGAEYWYSKYFALRVGGFYDKQGKLMTDKGWPIPTFGIGLRFAGYGFDAGFTLGDPGHPLANTVRFSLNMEF